MKEEKIEVTIQGITPLLMNKPNITELSDKAKLRQAGDKLNQQFETKQYKTSENKLFIPDTHIRGALIEAGKNIKVSGKGKATYSKIIGYAVRIQPAQILHKKTRLEKYTVLAVNPTTKGRSPLCRPLLKEWEVDFQIIYDKEEIPLEALKQAIDLAGKRIGIGDWRPQKKGSFGKFIVTNFK